MNDWRVLVSDSLDKKGIAILRQGAQVDGSAEIAAVDLIEIIHDYHALIVRGRTKVNKSIFDSASVLRVVGRAGVGVDNIDLAEAQKKGVIVVNTPTATTQAVVEHTITLMLALIRHIPKADDSMKSGQWEKKRFAGTELFNKTIGIVGIGRIGAGVARIASAFGSSILAYDPFISDTEIRARGAEPVDLMALYRRSDLITFHLPLTPESKNFVDGQQFGFMKSGVRIICAARGGIIDETALLSALESGHVSAAALDVFSNEPPGLTALVAHPHVISTPHIGAQTREAQSRASIDIANEVLAALDGDELRWRIV